MSLLETTTVLTCAKSTCVCGLEVLNAVTNISGRSLNESGLTECLQIQGYFHRSGL
jgi:hypothetical protein